MLEKYLEKKKLSTHGTRAQLCTAPSKDQKTEMSV